MTRQLCTTVVLLLVISLHAFAAPAPSPSCLVSPGRAIGPLSLGMGRDEVIQVWGSPDTVEVRPTGGLWIEYALLRLGLVGLNGEGKVDLIAVDDDRCLATTESIAVGDPRDRVYSVYGQPSEASDAILSAILVRRKARLWIGTGFQDLYFDSYYDRGLTIITGQTMHLNGYAPNGQPIFLAVDPQPLVRVFMIYPRRLPETVGASRHGGVY